VLFVSVGRRGLRLDEVLERGPDGHEGRWPQPRLLDAGRRALLGVEGRKVFVFEGGDDALFPHQFLLNFTGFCCYFRALATAHLVRVDRLLLRRLDLLPRETAIALELAPLIINADFFLGILG
jgi:hypothetical protein